MKALVVGGTRFVGLHLVYELVRQGHDVTTLNRGKTQRQLPPEVKRLYADRRQPEAVRSALEGQDFEVIFDMTGYQRINLEPLVDLFAGRIRRYIFMSTCGVYAHSETMPVTEDFPRLSPVTTATGLAAYEVEKVQCEDFLMETYRERGFPVTILRSPFIYGPDNWMDDREGSYFTRFTLGRKVLVPGDGTAINHFNHVDDVARALITAAGVERAIGQAFNIGCAQAITINGYIDTIARVTGKETEKVYLELKVVRDLKTPIFPFDWDKSQFFSIEKAREQLGFSPQYDMESGLRHTYEWWLKEKGVERMEFTPGRLGHDVDLALEDELIAKYG